MYLGSGTPSSEEALRLAGLDWEVIQLPVFNTRGMLNGYKAKVIIY